MSQRSETARLQHRSQNRTLRFASSIAADNSSTSPAGAFSRWKAMRCADFGPIPGSRPSWSISSCIGAV